MKKQIEQLNNELSTSACTGKFIGNERGFGFVEVEGRKKDIFIPPSNINGAMHGDEVLVLLVDSTSTDANSATKHDEGKIIKILNRAVKEVVGTYYKLKDFSYVVADDRHIFSNIFIAKKERKKAKSNDKVLVKITKYPTKESGAEGKIIEILGKANDEETDLISVLKTYDYKLEFPKDAQKEANEIPQVAMDLSGREDLREKEIFTIDGVDTKDMDDAISLECTQNKYKLGVHIADVSHYVKEDAELDMEARRRGTSVYLIDTVIPMLPKELSNGICSLNEGEDRYALSIDIVLDNEANVLNTKVYKSIINSKKKMTYDDVYKVIGDEFKEKRVVPQGYENFVRTLTKMKELAEKLKEKRHGLGAIDFDISEAKITLDENGAPLEVKPYEITIANQMIEQFMVLANECIAKKFSELEIPIIYRVHEKPEKEKLERLKNLIKNLDYDIKISEDEVKPYEIQNIIEMAKGKPEETVVTVTALRAMSLAIYSNENLGHFGLSLENYCHFTSPIRRYPDLFTHRMITKYLCETFTEKEKQKYKKKAYKYSEISSEMEKKAEEAEREYDEIKMCEYMAEHVGEEFEGFVSGLTNFGVFVELPNTIEGLCHVENMKDDYYIFDEESMCLKGERTNRTFKMGDRVKIKVISSSKITRRIDFEIV